jgi:hypothetical protein
MDNTPELTIAHTARQDQVDNAVFRMLTEVWPRSNDLPEWDIELIGEARDAIAQLVMERTGATEMDFYPYQEVSEFSAKEIGRGMSWVRAYKHTAAWPDEHWILMDESLMLRLWYETAPNELRTFAALYRIEDRAETGPSLLIYQENYLDEL